MISAPSQGGPARPVQLPCSKLGWVYNRPGLQLSIHVQPADAAGCTDPLNIDFFHGWGGLGCFSDKNTQARKVVDRCLAPTNRRTQCWTEPASQQRCDNIWVSAHIYQCTNLDGSHPDLLPLLPLLYATLNSKLSPCAPGFCSTVLLHVHGVDADLGQGFEGSPPEARQRNR